MSKIKNELPIVKNSLNAHLFPFTGEINLEPSLTIPDQTMSMLEILQRFAKGLPFEAGKVPIYDGEDGFPDLSKMDLADREDYLIAVNKEVKDLTSKIKRSEHEATKAKQRKEYYEEFQKELQITNPDEPIRKDPTAGNG